MVLIENEAENTKKKEAAENDAKWALKKQRIKELRDKEKEKKQKALLEPNIKGNLVVWTDRYKNGKVYDGSYKDIALFEIHRGILFFSLKIINEKIKYYKKNISSPELIKLQETAVTILRNNIKAFDQV